MKKIFMKHLVVIFSVTVTQTAAAAEDSFIALDRNADGFISAEESIVNQALYKRWSAADANKDGRIDTMEFSAFEINNDQAGRADPAP